MYNNITFFKKSENYWLLEPQGVGEWDKFKGDILIEYLGYHLLNF